MASRIKAPRNKIEQFCRKYHLRKLALFGSVLRDDFRPDSDIDVLVEFEPQAGIGYFELYDMEQELSRIFGGRTVEINTAKSLSRYYRDEVIAEAEVQYDKT